MKDYTLTIDNNDDREKSQKRFILKYEVKENRNGKKKITVYYANGNEGHVNYSSLLEKTVLDLMEFQVKEYKLRMQEYEIEYKNGINSLNLENRLGILLIGIIVVMGMMSTASLSMLLLSAVVPTFLFGSLIIDVVNILRQKKLVDDFNKMLLFVENKDKINKHILDKDNKFIKEINDILEKVCINNENGQREITINLLDKINLNKLKKIVNKINLKETFEVIEWAYAKKKEIVIEKGKEIEKQIRGERRSPFESLLSIEDVARLRKTDELRYQYQFNDENKPSLKNERDEASLMCDINRLEKKNKRRVKKL